MYDRILVPLDGSQLAEKVLGHVEEMAVGFDSDVILLQVVPGLGRFMSEAGPLGTAGESPVIGEMSDELAKRRHGQVHDQALAYLERKAQDLNLKGVKVEIAVSEGEAGAGILEYARKAGVSLIAMTTHGRGGLGRLVFGSVTDEVLRNADAPLLLVRADDS